ncbi:hypothetical protein PHYBOEH_006966 [Phytophthora boehmeriae]|uniref:Uncharacterized protein n=1 Tax=Phytophthora boehmeriae TaxID=109152 RepID=A0A8T1WB96_9STRA|nr:hypothetical protein PHYBOEH_006966 [Phytophthora boehmeriae]
MTHRFPLQEAVFPPLQLLTKTQEKYVKTAQTQLSRALHDYDRYHKWQSSRPPSLRYQLHPAMWKPVKTCEQLTVYRRVPVDDAVVTAPKGTRRRARSRTLEAARMDAAQGQDSVSSAPKESTADYWPWVPNRGSVPTINGDWTMPTLLQVGTIEGTLEEVMYGSVTFTAADTLIKATYTSSEIVDAETLYEIQGPTNDEPFRFLGLKWAVKATSPAVKAFVWPRDLIYLEATGILDRQGGERVGYHLMHSLELGKGFDALEGKRIPTPPTRVEHQTKKLASPIGGKGDTAILAASDRPTWDLDSDAEEEDDYDRTVVSSRALSLDPECAGTTEDSLPEAVVQYAWGEVVPSPSHRNSLTSPAPWPSPPSSPLQSPSNLPTESEVTWPASEGERAKVWTAPAMPQIRRINAGASTQEVLAQFAELCNAAENAYQTTRKHTITHIDPILEPSQRTTRFDMSAVD